MTYTIVLHDKTIEAFDNPIMDEIFSNFSLMYEHYISQDEIEAYFLASDNGKLVGFLGVGYCGRTVVIEVLDSFQGKGIGSSLINAAIEKGFAKAWRPKQNGCEEFWVKMAELASENPNCNLALV
ncbi:GNAT family N-acetyltransferase [Allocoleopsis sp.]|uniref:GNAT family N-acetyltransferase n=1 Tax=Allocoleopsis sp. TaxID=3088169 RepID=UPI002FCF7D28